MMFRSSFLFLVFIFLASPLNIQAQNNIDIEAEIESEIEPFADEETQNLPPLRDEGLEDDIANSIEDDEFSDGTIEDDIANSLEKDEITPYVYRGEITPYSKENKLIDHPYASKGLYKITKDREYLYKINESDQAKHVSVRFGMFNPSNLQTEDGQFFFDELYEDSNAPLLLFDWEWQLQFLGRLSFKLGTGLYYAQGNGRFNSPNAPDGLQPLEDFSLFMLPNSANVVYKLQFWNKQILVPYADAGLDGFTLMEFQEGEGAPKLGASLGGHISLGLALNINFLDYWSVVELDRDYGINSVYLVGEFRNYFHITGSYDFSGSFINGGLAFDF